MIAFLIIVYVAIVLVLFKVLRIKPTAYLIASMILLGVFMIGGVVVVWTQSAPITDKMVTSQYVVQLVPYVKGQVKAIHAQANQLLKKGDLLLEIDPAPYQYTVNQVEAQLTASKANVKQAEAALATANAAIPNAQASLAKAKAADELAKTQEQIALNIQRADKAAISQLNVAKATQERQEADAAVQQAEAALAQAQASAQQAAAALVTAQSNVPAVEAQLDDARFNLAQCKMSAPGDGYVTNWQVQVGTMLVPMPLAAAGTFVNVSDTAVAAVFPQNWLSNVEPGDDVEMVLLGKVDYVIASYDGVLVSLLADVTATYIGIRTTEQLIGIARANVRRQEQALSIAKAKFTGGGTSELDVFQATNVLEQTRATIPQLMIQLQQGQNALCVLLGVPPQSLGMMLSRTTGRIPSPPASVVVGIPADLLRRRPDVRAAELAALAQSAQIGVALTQLYPAISITGTFGGSASTANGHNLGEVVSWKGVAYAAGPSFQWNLLNYGQITNNIRLQDAKLQQLLIDYQNSVLSAQQEVDNGLATYLQSRNQAAYLRRSVEAANGALKIGLEQYEQGATSFTTVLTAEQNLLQAQNSLAGAAANVPLGLTAVFRALGGGWQIREGGNFVSPATVDQMRARTDWGNLLPAANEPQPPAPGLPGPGDIGPTIRPPEW